MIDNVFQIEPKKLWNMSDMWYYHDIKMEPGNLWKIEPGLVPGFVTRATAGKCCNVTEQNVPQTLHVHHFSYGKIMEKSGISGELHPFSRFFPWKIHRNSTLPRCAPGSRSQRLARASPSASSASHRIWGQGLPSSWETWMKSVFFFGGDQH